MDQIVKEGNGIFIGLDKKTILNVIEKTHQGYSVIEHL